MSGTSEQERVLDVLRRHRSELEAMGVVHVALFGSRARGEHDAGSDVDLGVALDPERVGSGLAYFGARQRLEDRLHDLLGAPVELSDETMMRPRVRAAYARERLYAF